MNFFAFAFFPVFFRRNIVNRSAAGRNFPALRNSRAQAKIAEKCIADQDFQGYY